MEEKLLDPTLIGVVIGALLSLIGNVITQYFSLKKEERQWERQRISSKEERGEIASATEMKDLRELYHKCVLALSVYTTKSQHEEENNQSLTEEIKDVHHWLSMLLLRHPHKKLSRLIDSFLHSPHRYDAEQLRKYVLELVEHEEALDYPGRIKETLNPKSEAKNNGRTVSFRISEAFRREQMVQGIEVPPSYQFSYEFDALTNEQRERLLKVYFPSMKRVPENAQLYLPALHPGAKQINLQSKQWEANVNPEHTNVGEILNLWGQEFDQHLEVAENQWAKNA